MSRMLVIVIIRSGFRARRSFPVAIGRNGISSSAATRDSRPPALPAHTTRSSRPSAASRARSDRTAASAGYVCPPLPPPVTTSRNGTLLPCKPAPR
jgi:hypothetical protein